MAILAVCICSVTGLPRITSSMGSPTTFDLWSSSVFSSRILFDNDVRFLSPADLEPRDSSHSRLSMKFRPNALNCNPRPAEGITEVCQRSRPTTWTGYRLCAILAVMVLKTRQSTSLRTDRSGSFPRRHFSRLLGTVLRLPFPHSSVLPRKTVDDPRRSEELVFGFNCMTRRSLVFVHD